MDFEFTDAQRMIRDTVRAFVSKKVMPIIALRAREGRFPAELVAPMGELGLLGANLEGYECPGLGPVAYGLIMQELERGDSAVRSFVSVQGSLCMYPIHRFGSDEQRKRWLPPMSRGEAIGCFGLTEPDHGSDAGGMETRAELQGDRWVLNGTKAWITNGCIAAVAIVWAQPPEGIRGFLVEQGTPGFTTSRVEGKFSLRASVTSGLAFQDCAIPRDHLLPGTEGLKSALSCLNQARYGIAWGTIGSAMAVYDEALRYAKERTQFGKPIASFQIQQQKLVWMLNEITKGQLMNLRLGRMKEKGRARAHHVSMAKRNNCWVARETARLGREILGANGIMDEYQVFRHLVNIESVYTYEGTHDIHTLILGERITGLPAYQ